MTPVRKLVWLLVTLGLLGLAQGAGATALPQQTGAFGISPARRIVVGTPGMALTPTTVVNTTNSVYAVTVFPALLQQNLTGAFDFAQTPRNLSASRLILSASPTGFVLAPGQQQRADLRWNLLPAGRRWVAVGVVFQGIPKGQTGALHVIARLLSVNFLRLPGPAHVDGIFAGLYPEQFGRRALRFVARVKNTGDQFSAPSDGHLVITDAAGQTVYIGPWSGPQILPGAEVDFPIDVKKVLPAGSYTATATMDFGGRRSTSSSFTLVGPNQLPTPQITISGFNAAGVVGSPARATGRIISSGTAPASVAVRLYLGRAGEAPGQNALATSQVVYRNLAPGSVTRLSLPLGGALRKGSYQAILTWTDPTGAPHTLQAEFTTTASQSTPAVIWSFIKRQLLLWIGLLVLGLVMALAYVVRRVRGRQRQIQAELAAVRAQLRAATEDDPGTAANPAASRSSRVRTQTGTRAKAKAKPSRTTPPRRRTPVKSGEARSNGASAGSRPTAAKSRTRSRPNGADANDAKPDGVMPTRAKLNGGDKPNGAKSTARKPTAPKSAAAKSAARKAAAPSVNGANANGASANGAKANGSHANGGTSNGAKTGPRSRSTGVKSNPAPSTATPAQPESTPSSQSGSGSELRSTDVRANRAGELLALASRSHARRPLPRDQDDA